MRASIACSLIISTYNWPQALELCLASVLNQTQLPNEIIVSDDGSTFETRNMVESFIAKSTIPIKHIWHEDDGFQLAKIRNKSINAAAFDYIIQIDADIILHPNFIEDHLEIAEQGYFITGSRTLLSEELSKNVLKNKTVKFGSYIKGSKNFLNGLRNKTLRNYFSTRYKITGKNKFDVKGCNMSFWKTDLITVNGYDEQYSGWGREDSDIAIRLINSGIKKKYLKMGGIEYHIFHKEVDRKNLEENTIKMNNSILNNIKWAEKGLSQYQ